MRGRICFGVLLLPFLAPSLIHAQGFGKDLEQSLQVQAPADYPEANAVVIFDRERIDVTTSEIKFRRHVRLKILTKSGIGEVGEQSFLYVKGSDKVSHFKAQTITPDGKKHKVKSNAVFEKKYGDVREKTFAFPVLDTGCVIEYRYQISSSNYRYLRPWYFQSDIYTLLSEVTVGLAPGFNYTVSHQNTHGSRAPKKSTEQYPDHPGERLRVFTWSQKNLPPIGEEPFMSASENYRSSLKFQLTSFRNAYSDIKFVETWGKLGEDFDKYLKKYTKKKKKDVKRLAEEIVAGLQTQREKSEAIYNYVSSEFKNKSSNLYLSNETLADLLKSKIGTPEEKNLLLIELHRQLGMDAKPLLISTRSHARFHPRAPDLRDFNYLIAYVSLDDGSDFVDVSDRFSEYGILPPECLTEGGLLIDGAESALISMTVGNVHSARQDVTKMYVSDTGVVTCSLTCKLSGYYASEYSKLYDTETGEDFLQDHLMEFVQDDYELLDSSFARDSVDRFVMSANYTSRDLVTELDNNLIIRPVCYEFGENPFKSKQRFFPVDFMYPFTFKNVVEIHCEHPPGRYLLPEDIDIAIPGMSLERWSAVKDGIAVVVTEFAVKRPTFDPSQYDKVREIFQKMAEADAGEVTALFASADEADK